MRRALPLALLLLTSCSLAPDLEQPDIAVPDAYRGQSVAVPVVLPKGSWTIATPREKEDRGAWWQAFDDAKLNELEEQAIASNQSLVSAAMRVEEARKLAGTVEPTIFPTI